jgi:hypothetical protein
VQDANKPESIRSFVVSIVLVLVACLSLIALFDWWTDPFVAFDHPVRPGINDLLSQAFFHSPRDQQRSWLIRRGRQTGGGDILLGASQILHGMNTCPYPRLQRLGLPGLQETEIVEFLRSTETSFAPGTRLFIDLTFPGGAVPQSEDRGILFLWRNLLQSATTKVGFGNLLESQRATRTACAPMPLPNSLRPGYDQKYFLHFRDSAVGEQHTLDVLFASLAPLCERHDIEIEFFTLPVDFDASIADRISAHFRHQSDLVLAAKQDFARRFPSCKVTFEDLGSEYTMKNLPNGPSHDDWLDTTHFKPVVGDKLLAEILSDHGE